MIRLYSWGTPNGNKLHIFLEELGAPYELIPVNLQAGAQHDPDFRKISPNGKIPAIVDIDGPGGAPLALAESGAILLYLAGKTGRFMPSDPRDHAAMLQWIMFQMGHVGPMIGQLHHFRSSAPAGNDYGIERYRKEGERLLDVLDLRLKDSGHLACADYTIADICTWPWIRSWLHTVKQPIGERPHLRRWYDAIERRPAVMRAVEIMTRLRAMAKT